ncbi:MAG: lipoprotein signal peptidase [Bacteroidota bacterium]
MKKNRPVHLVLLIVLIILVDQLVKIWIKTHYPIGEVVRVGGMGWFRIHFIENPGMAWGWKFGNENGKLILTLFRLAAVIFGTWYLGKMLKQEYSRGLMICAGLIYAGALGNLIDSMFYGMLFNKGLHYDASIGEYISYTGTANLGSTGYSSFLHGSVVDMLYFPMIHSNWPSWIPIIGGEEFEFFSPIFNIADAAISIGVLVLFFFQKRLLQPVQSESKNATVSTSQKHNDTKEIF